MLCFAICARRKAWKSSFGSKGSHASRPPAGGAASEQPPAASSERGGALLARLADADPSLSADFTSASQRAQLLRALERVTPPAGTRLTAKGEVADGLLLIEVCNRRGAAAGRRR